MYAQLYVADGLPGIPNALNYQWCLVTGNWLMLATVALISVFASLAYGFEDRVSMPMLVLSHASLIVLFGLLKIGYLLRCIALNAFGNRDF